MPHSAGRDARKRKQESKQIELNKIDSTKPHHLRKLLCYEVPQGKCQPEPEAVRQRHLTQPCADKRNGTRSAKLRYEGRPLKHKKKKKKMNSGYREFKWLTLELFPFPSGLLPSFPISLSAHSNPSSSNSLPTHRWLTRGAKLSWINKQNSLLQLSFAILF